MAGGAPAPVALYVHFPFCRHRCPYCHFSVARASRPPVAEWLACLEADAAAWFAALEWDPPVRVDTLYVGGGTPSLLGAEGVTALGRVLRRWFAWEEGAEWSVEANPGSLTTETCREWRRAGVTRVSVGVQSLREEALRWLGRDHDVQDAESGVRWARQAGIGEVSVDLLFGLPPDVPREWKAEVERALDLGVTHLSAYGLSAEPRTPLGRRVELGRASLAGEAAYETEYLEAAEAMAAAGYVHYEVSNFALPGHECAHNWHYWDGSPYLGLGPSAHSFLPPLRLWNAWSWPAYREAVRRRADLGDGRERVGGGRAELERLWLGLRTRRGIRAAEPVWRVAVRDGRAGRWEAQGWVIAGGRVRLTPAGWLRMDALVTSLAAGARRRAGEAIDAE